MPRRDSLLFFPFFSFYFFYIFSLSLLAPSFLFHVRGKTTRLRTNAVTGDRLSVFVSPPHRFRFLPPHAVCLSPSSAPVRLTPNSFSLSLSLAGASERALPNTFLSRTRASVSSFSHSRAKNWLKRRHALVKFRDSAEQHAPFTASLVA